MIDQLRRLLAPLANRVTNLVVRAVVKNVDDAKKLQELQISVLDGEVRDEVERFQEYGFTSNPKPGAEVVAVCVGGRRDHTLAIGASDRRYRIKNLESGEVAVYDCTGSVMTFKTNGDIELAPSSGSLKITGAVDVTGDVTGNGISLDSHTHALTPANSPITVAGAAGTISGTTGGPS